MLRQQQERNTNIALFITCTIVGALLLIPYFKSLISKNAEPPLIPKVICDFALLPSIELKKDEIKVQAPPIAANTARSVEFVVRQQESVTEEHIATQEELSKTNIGITTTENESGNTTGMELGVVAGAEVAMRPEQVLPPKIYDIAEVMPEFPGGENALLGFISKNTVYPPRARDLDEEGKVYVKFVVNEDGGVSNVEVLRRAGFGFDEEAIRVIKMLPKFKPAMQNGTRVKVRFVLPIKFKIH